MAKYYYEATDFEGVNADGVIEAGSLYSARSKLEARDLIVSSIGVGKKPGRAKREPNYEPKVPRPPPPPRDVPRGSTGKPRKSFFFWLGGGITAMASLCILMGASMVRGGDSEGWFMIWVAMFQLLIGLGMLAYGIRVRLRLRQLVRHGLVAAASIEGVTLDTSMGPNVHSPFLVHYQFQVGGETYSGRRSTLKRSTNKLVDGDSIWVLYHPDAPGVNVEWTPL